MARERRNRSKQPMQEAPPGLAFHVSAAKAAKMLLGLALAGALIVYWPALRADWFYDDVDYIVNDPRLEHLELFMPGHWNDPPPPLEVPGISIEQMPGYGKPLIGDRYVWRLSFALERRVFGSADSAEVAHGINLAFHLACICTLFVALRRWTKVYLRATVDTVPDSAVWALLPGMAALIFAVHPWAAEPVCYSTARSASMGTLFTLTALWLTAGMFGRPAAAWGNALRAAGVGMCALAAFGCKENFMTLLPACGLVALPFGLRRFGSLARWRLAAACAAGLVFLGGVAWLAIRSSERARGLFEQTSLARSWNYLFEIQSPLVLQTLFDLFATRRISVEFNHPEWSAAACWAALAANLVLAGGAFTLGLRRPLFLGVCWYYLHLLPTNSILVRQDFLASRNVYAAMAGIAAVFAGGMLWGGERILRESQPRGTWSLRAKCAALAGALLIFYWGAVTHQWAEAFTTPDLVWAQSAKIAPDHATVRLNYAVGLLNSASHVSGTAGQKVQAEHEVRAALEAETSPTMQFHNPSHRAARKAVAFRILAHLRRDSGNFKEAEKFFRESFDAKPLVAVWAEWAEICLDSGADDALRTCVEAGLRTWPGAWPPIAVRGMLRSKEGQGRQFLAEAMTDLKAAENAPDDLQPELRHLQVRILFGLAQTPDARPRLGALIDRLHRLGLSAEQLRPLTAIQSSP